MNFNNQFNNPEIDPRKEYWYSPLTKGFTKLMKLVLMGDKYLDEIKKELLINPSTINIKNTEGWTALIISARNTNTKSSNTIIKLLLEHKANVNDKENTVDWTSLMMASMYSNTDSSNETVKLLLEHKANINDKHTYGSTSLILASRYSNTYSSNETVKLLLENKANINDKTNYGYTSLMMASIYSNTESSNETVK